jgi:hypothetical protein
MLEKKTTDLIEVPILLGTNFVGDWNKGCLGSG